MNLKESKKKRIIEQLSKTSLGRVSSENEYNLRKGFTIQ